MRRELNRAILKREQLLEHSSLYKEDDLFKLLENLQMSIDEMNNAFYEIASDLEGKYSQHEKEIQLIEAEIASLSKRSKANSVQDERYADPIAMHKAKMDLSKDENAHKKEIESMKLDESMGYESEITLRDQVVKRRSEGASLKAIAKELNIGMGELQLLIQLPDVTKKI
ncbi:DUF6115 domain-containing protein [Fusibacter sp. 3D3]|uniref:DUF6115 domain-containing protein n=1 Tax=Fusibacter sp. 3D3 TaxID=1048380 RepID=UPI00158680B4|nr:hypothetical protein [Fusibacter sp. 3D3]